jgi:hypothetical protein
MPPPFKIIGWADAHDCGRRQVLESDGNGRTRVRCYPCLEGVTRNQKQAAPQQLLPPVAPGQLRCQVCASGVENSKARFCAQCIPARRAGWNQTYYRRYHKRTPRTCACGGLIEVRRGRPRTACDTCLGPPRPRKPQRRRSTPCDSLTWTRV